MMNPTHAKEFVTGPGTADLGVLHGQVANDMDIIAETASFAMNNLSDAVEPETYARVKKNQPNYSFTVLPTNLPRE